MGYGPYAIPYYPGYAPAFVIGNSRRMSPFFGRSR
jgi:hypothetical protein